MEFKYNIYKLKDGRTYLSNGCPRCSSDRISIDARDIELIDKAREMKD